MTEADRNAVQHLIRQQMESLHRAGVRQLPSPQIYDAPITAGLGEEVAGSPLASAPVAHTQSSTIALTGQSDSKQMSVDERTTDRPPALREKTTSDDATAANLTTSPQARQALLDEVHTRVISCEKCQELCSTRTQTVFGVGNPTSRLVFLGEAPGADEDRLGEPFVGKAGQLLDKILAACTLRREDVYILNILKCRPPGNRNPTEIESANCEQFLRSQLDIIQPEYICCLGSVAAKNLLKTETSIGRLRGRFHDWRGIQVLATYHPAYLLRNPAAKAEVWKDMQFLAKEMGIELPPR